MANHKSALKRAKQSEVKKLRNKSVKTRMKNIIKTVKSGEAENIQEVFIKAQSVIDKAAKKGVIKKKAAAKKNSRLAKFINAEKVRSLQSA